MENYYQRNLPHYQPTQGEFFVTFRLSNSLPYAVVLRLKKKYQHLLKQPYSDEIPESKVIQQKKYLATFDRLLDQAKSGVHWLKEDRIAKIIADKMHSFDDQKYLLICYCIMPNHVHLLFKLSDRDESRSTYPVTDILRLIKGSTARKANIKLQRTGSFWQRESYDHLVRDDEERENIIRYILLNPVKAHLVHSWKDWKWTYCKEEYLPVR